jgi:hypothetical protein
MKVQTNLRAGKQNRGATSGGGTKPNDSSSDEVYVPPVSRCVGI